MKMTTPGNSTGSVRGGISGESFRFDDKGEDFYPPSRRAGVSPQREKKETARCAVLG